MSLKVRRAASLPYPHPIPLRTTLLLASLLAALPEAAAANCALQSDGTTVICDSTSPNPFTSSINAIASGSGTLLIPASGAVVNIQSGASVSTSGAAVQVNNNSTVTNAGSISTTFINAYGIWAGDPGNSTSTTAGYGNTLENDGTVTTTGNNSVGLFARTYNKTSGNTLINRGGIQTSGGILGTSNRSSSAGIRSESVVASTIDNYGVVAAHGAYSTIGTGNVMAIAGNGVEMAGPGTFINEAGASVTSDNAYGFYGNGANANGITVINAGALSGGRGAILFGPGQSNNTVVLKGGSTTTGSIDAGVGGSNNALVFDGFSSTGFANAILNWQMVTLRNSANVTFNGASYALVNMGIDGTSAATFTTAPLTISGQITDNGALTFAVPGNVTIAASIQGSGALTQRGTGTLTLTGAGSYSGATTVASSVLLAGASNIFSSASAYTVASGAALDLGNANQAIGSLAGGGQVLLGSGNLTTGGLGSSTTFSGVISGSGAVIKNGAGTFTLAGGNTYTGGTTISAGTLQLGNGSTDGSIVGNVTNNGALVFDRSDTNTFAGVISGSGSVAQAGSGTTVLTASNTYIGDTTISAGSLQLGNGGTTGSIVGNVTNNGALVFNRSDINTFAGAISGSGSTTQTGSGTTLLTGDSTYTGGTTISAGTLQLGNGGASGSIVGNVTNNGALVFNRSDTNTFAGVISGAGSVNQIGSGTTVLTGDSTYTGGTTISAGTLQLGNGVASGGIIGNVTNNGALVFDRSDTNTFAGVISGAGSVTQSGSGATVLTGDSTYAGGTTISAGTLQLGNGGTTGSVVGDVTNSGALVFNRSDTNTFAGVVSGSGSVVQAGGGTTVLTANNTYAGGTMINAGTLQLGNGGTTGSILGDVTNNGALVFSRSDTNTFAGVISGTGSVNQIGSGTTVLTGDNTYSGGTTITAGMLKLGDGGATGSLVGNVANNGRLIFDRVDTVTFPGAISGTGSVKQLGTGTTILTDANTYSGGTVIAGGALQLGNGGTSGSMVGNVQNGSLLIFNRSDTVTFNGVISDWTQTTPDPIGAVTQNGSGVVILDAVNTYSGLTSVNAGTLVVGDASHASAALSGGGAVSVAANASFGGYGSTAGDVNNQGTVAVANALPVLASGAVGSFTIGGTLNNAALLQLGGNGVGNTLVTGSYVGQNARIALNTVLGGDGSPSDRLVINGGSASGQTTLNVTNVGGLGAVTEGNGILVVRASNGATTTANAFTLGNYVEAGPYLYTLFQGSRDSNSPSSWYLRTDNPDPPVGVVPPTTTPTPPPTSPPGSGNPPVTPLPPVVPNYRAEVSLYTALPSMMLRYGTTLVGTLHEREGAQESTRGLVNDDGWGASQAWARVLGEDGEWNARTGGIYRDGPSFDSYLLALQAGLDLYRGEQANGTRDFAGLLGSVGHGHGGVDNFDNTSAGNDRFDAYSLGAYWTRFNASDAYLDGVVQATWYSAKARSNEQQNLSTDGFGATASLEGGYPFAFANGWSLEPQAQAIYQSLHLDNASDSSAQVRFGHADSLTARIGSRLANQWQGSDASQQYTGWVLANLWHEFNADPRTAFSSAEGWVPFRSDLTGTWWEVGGGLNAQLSANTAIYATLSYQKGFGNGVKAFNGNLGVRFHW